MCRSIAPHRFVGPSMRAAGSATLEWGLGARLMSFMSALADMFATFQWIFAVLLMLILTFAITFTQLLAHVEALGRCGASLEIRFGGLNRPETRGWGPTGCRGCGLRFVALSGGALDVLRAFSWRLAGALAVRCPYASRRPSTCEVEGPVGRLAVGRALGRSVGRAAGSLSILFECLNGKTKPELPRQRRKFLLSLEEQVPPNKSHRQVKRCPTFARKCKDGFS